MREINKKLLDFISQKVEQYYPEDCIRVFLFGSRANNTHKKRSDYDLAFDIPYGLNDSGFLLTVQEEAPTLCGIDAINLNKTSDNLKNKILKEGVLLYESAKKG